jgi:PII-like signaling protein
MVDRRPAVIDECLKVTSYFGERLRVGRRFYSDVLLDTFEEYDVSSSILLRATGGFGLRHHLRTDQTLTMSEDPSVMAVAVDAPSRMNVLLSRLAEVQPRGMLTVERARVIRDDVLPAQATPEHHTETKLTIYVGRGERTFRVPTHIALCDHLQQRGVAGASVLLGVDGTYHGERQRARFWDRNLDVPSMVLAVGPSDRMDRVLPELGALLRRPMVTVERVRVCKRDGQLLERPYDLPDVDEQGLALWEKLMIYTSESQLHEGEPVHRALTRRLRQTQASGVTSVRGVWGFHGDHPAHGDRIAQVGRRVPVVTIVVDSPSRIAASFDVIDELTTEHGLVTCEMVPAMQYFQADESRRGGLRMARHRF